MDLDPITTAIVAALSAGANTAAGDVAKKAIVDGYNGLKALLKNKFGDDNSVIEAVDASRMSPNPRVSEWWWPRK